MIRRFKQLSSDFFFEPNGWTRGQYALFRRFLSLHLFAFNLHLALSVDDRLAIFIAFFGALLSVLLFFGFRERTVAFALAAIWALFFGVRPNGPHDSQQLLVFVLLAHTELAPTVRNISQVPWRMPQPIHALMWIISSAYYVFYGVSVIVGYDYPIMLLLFLFSPLAFFPTLRPLVWLLNSVLVSLLLASIGNVVSALVLLQIFLWDPKWLPGVEARKDETVFFDGECSMCHGAVLFALEEDQDSNFIFSPLSGSLIGKSLSEEVRNSLPDSSVILTDVGTVLTKSAGMRHVLRRLGGMWRVLAALMAFIPLSLADFVYDQIAASRKKLFRATTDICPLAPPAWAKKIIR